MTTIRFFFIIALSTHVLSPLLLGASWTLRDGKTIQGNLHMIQNKRVRLNLPLGQSTQIHINDFSKSSQTAIANWARGQEGSLDFASWIKSPDSAFSKPWPRTVYGPNSPSVHSIQKDSKLGRYVFESDHYRFISDEKLSTQIVQRFATLFETTYLYNMALPLNVPGRYHGKGHKYIIYLFGRYENYLRSGGPAGSAGVYTPRNKVILVPLMALGVYKTGSKWGYVKGDENLVLAHEITHQLMDGILQAAWFIEGSAEYIAQSPYTHAAYHVYGSKRHIFDSVASKKASNVGKSRQLGPRVIMPKLQRFMNLPYAQFARGDRANQNYGMALLLTYYFYHEDAAKNAFNMKNYVKALQRGKNELEAQKALLNGRSYETVEKAFGKFCANNGLTVDFK